MPEQNGGYYSRSWVLLTKDQGWIKPLLVLGAAMLVPVVGFLGVLGYALEWARLTAWGVDAAPKQKNVRVGECISSGWRGFLAGAGYAFAAAFLNNLILTWFSTLGIAQVLSFVVSFLGNVAFTLAALRATIYQDISAGYTFDRIWEMVKRDSDGFMRVVMVIAATSIVVGLATALLFMVAIIPMLVGFALNIDASGFDLIAGNITEPTVRYIFFEFLDQLASLAPLLTVVGFIGAVGSAFTMLINTNAMALWVRQFDVPAWGASNDPLPMAYGLPPAGYGAQQAPYQQAPYQQDQPYQQPYQQPAYQQEQDLNQQPQPTYQPQMPVQQDAPLQQDLYAQPEVPQTVAAPPQEAPTAEVERIELAPIGVVNAGDMDNNVEDKVVTTDTEPSQAVPEPVEPTELADVPEAPEAPAPEPAPEPTPNPAPADEPVAAEEESVQPIQEEPQTEPEDPNASEEE